MSDVQIVETEILAGSSAIELVQIGAGVFIMGTGNVQYSESPAHEVKLEQSFLMGKYPITQEQWQAVMGCNQSHGT